MDFRIRPPKPDDFKDVFRMVTELSLLEKSPDLQISREELKQDLFCETPFLQCLIAEVPAYCKTWEGKGVGRALLSTVAKVGKEQHCAIMLTEMRGNTPLIDFYIAKGGEDLTVTERRHFLRFDGDALDKLAQEAPQCT
ncbi:thialysine N-epsilon-acetyltransferase-like isoform X2 [Alosa alosa]|uniref:thialysine N-epsilon-acetyltransferase-like isoform X2 n=1 Tax=Alosa alosa TaxID=278164 RepID=UPI0020152AB7|nr:thialysine N-epsilon-acetyltransferase-like isoform X2 [Alosa alosa]